MKPGGIQEAVVRLVRLAWGLREMGVSVSLELPYGRDPVVVVPRASEPLRIMARCSGRAWAFTWGRGPRQTVLASSRDVTQMIMAEVR